MENQMSQTRSINTDELHDNVFLFKVSGNPSLLEILKQVEKPEVFTSLNEFCNDDVKVCSTFIHFNYKRLRLNNIQLFFYYIGRVRMSQKRRKRLQDGGIFSTKWSM